MKDRRYGRVQLSESKIDELRKSELGKYTEGYFVNEYWKEDLPGCTGNRGLAYPDPEHSARFHSLWQAVQAVAVGGTFLDAGCGTGCLTEAALRERVVIRGIDASPSAVNSFHERTANRFPGAVSVGSICALNFADNMFDVVVCFDVLEHVLVFDCFDAVSELCRVAGKQVILSINLDNPYEYHPTILSRDTWVTMFEATGLVRSNEASVLRMSEDLCPSRPEYDFFVFDKVG